MSRGIRIRNIVPASADLKPVDVRLLRDNEGLAALPYLPLEGGDPVGVVAYPASELYGGPVFSVGSGLMGVVPNLEAEVAAQYISVIQPTQRGADLLRGLWRGISTVLKPFKNMADAWASGTTFFAFVGVLGPTGTTKLEEARKLMAEGEVLARDKDTEGATDKAVGKFVQAAKAMGDLRRYSYVGGYAWQRAADLMVQKAGIFWRRGKEVVSYGGDLETAKESWSRSLKFYPQAWDYYDEAARTYPGGPHREFARRRAGLMESFVAANARLMEQTRYEGAFAVITKVSMPLQKMAPTLETINGSYDRWLPGNKVEAIGDFELASVMYRFEAERAEANGRFDLAGRFYGKRGDMLVAVAHFNNDPRRHAMAAEAYGRSVEVHGRGEETWSSSKRGRAVALYKQARALVNAGEFENALRLIDDISKISLAEALLEKLGKLRARAEIGKSSGRFARSPLVVRDFSKGEETGPEFEAQQKRISSLFDAGMHLAAAWLAGNFAELYDRSNGRGKYRAAVMLQREGKVYELLWRANRSGEYGPMYGEKTLETYERALELFRATRINAQFVDKFERRLELLRQFAEGGGRWPRD